jgi:hypothetical protein
VSDAATGNEARAAAIVQSARAERRGSSRTLWIVAFLVATTCAIAFLVMMFADGAASTTPPRTDSDRGLGFGTGVVVGAIAGLGVGFAIARQRQSSRSKP